jgi:hypothetical protein
MRARILIKSDQQDSALMCLKICFAILDRVVKVKLSTQVKAKCDKVRRQKQVEQDSERAQKNAVAQREEEMRYQEKLRQLPIGEQQKLESKRRQQDLKQQKKKM